MMAIKSTLDTVPAPTDGLVPEDEMPGCWDYTQYASGVVDARNAAERRAGRLERPTISRDSRINGGVYEGSYGGEAIVVDSDTSRYINRVYEDVLRAISPKGTPNKQLALRTVFELVGNKMPYNQKIVDEIFATKANSRDHTKVSLDLYIGRGAGVCRHQALLVGVLLEKMVDDGVLTGRASVDRNMIQRVDGDEYDGHSWVRYTNSAGQVYILDVAQQRTGALSSLMEERSRGVRCGTMLAQKITAGNWVRLH